MEAGPAAEPTAAASNAEETRNRGKVARWTSDRGFGFIEPEDGAAHPPQCCSRRHSRHNHMLIRGIWGPVAHTTGLSAVGLLVLL
eukprot:scaffold270651_cov18-Tisochrysis_lutea.AAC.1